MSDQWVGGLRGIRSNLNKEIMVEPSEIYKKVEDKINEIDFEVEFDASINNEILENLKASSSQIRKILDKLQSEVKNLEHNSEWENYTISFIGETNAGKSTLLNVLLHEERATGLSAPPRQNPAAYCLHPAAGNNSMP